MDVFRRNRSLYILLLIFPYLYIFNSIFFSSSNPTVIVSNLEREKPVIPSLKSTDTERVLIIYVWADTDVSSRGNLEFFIRYGVHEAQAADYYFILQQVGNKTVNESSLPKLPPNAHYLQHENECFDMGTFGWFFGSKIVDITRYKYFILMNASIRGPFFTVYFPSEYFWWYHVFTRRLTDEVKLVGPSINCEQKPHVQSYLLATDQVGLKILTDKQNGVLSCKTDYTDAVVNGEIGASQILLSANYQIASLQIKYQGVDFRLKSNWNCNSRVSPIFVDNSVDGISHDPYELVFVKYKGTIQTFDSTLERRSYIYEKWLNEQPAAEKERQRRV